MILDMLARVEYSINFMEDMQNELPVEPLLETGDEVLSRLYKMINSSNKGRILKEGINTVIVGKPNVGKSSLLNALLKENRAIVTDVPGTTRDTIEEYLDLGGVSLKITDTAGIRETQDLVESIGVNKSIELIDDADLIIAIFDVSREFDEEDEKIMSLIRDRKSIILLNKHDLGARADKKDLLERFDQVKVIDMSIKDRKGIEELEESIMDMFFDGEINITDDTIITNLRHKHILEQAHDSLKESIEDVRNGYPLDAIEIDLRNAYTLLGEITGETIEDDVLDKIFKDFCIGK